MASLVTLSRTVNWSSVNVGGNCEIGISLEDRLVLRSCGFSGGLTVGTDPDSDVCNQEVLMKGRTTLAVEVACEVE